MQYMVQLVRNKICLTIKNNEEMATSNRIWQQYVFGRLDENNEIEYFKPYKGGLATTFVNSNGDSITKIKMKPTEADMNTAGWYRVVNVAEDGTDAVIDNVLYHYTGAIDISEEE